MATVKCPGWPHEYDIQGCDWDHKQYILESKPGETTMTQRAASRLEWHEGRKVDVAELLIRIAQLESMVGGTAPALPKAGV